MTGVVYAIECADLDEVYVGQTKRWPLRLVEHEAGKVKKSAHFAGHRIIGKVLAEAEPGPELNALEKRWSITYQENGWVVVSYSARIGYIIAAGEIGGTHARELGKKHDVTPEGRERMRAAGRKANAMFTHEQRVEAGRKGGQAHSKEHLSAAGKLGAAAALTPDVRARSVKNSFKVMRRCNECGAVYNAVHMGRHQKKTGHVGYTINDEGTNEW